MKIDSLKFYGFLAMIFIVIYCLFFIHAPGGVDLFNYEMYSERGIFSWTPYELKEVFSWLLIKVSYSISWSVGQVTALPYLVIILTIILSLRTSILIASIMMLFLLCSSFGVLLSQNVLRQFVGAIILYKLYESVFILKNSSVINFMWGGLSLISHNSSVVIIGIIYIARKKGIAFLIYSILLFSSLLVMGALGFIKYGGEYEDNSGVSEIIKITYFFSQYMFLYVALFYSRSDRDKSEDRFYITSIIMFLFLYLFGFPVWAINRLIISMLVLLLFSVVYSCLCFFDIKNKIILLIVFLLMIALLFLHKGALGMLVSYDL